MDWARTVAETVGLLASQEDEDLMGKLSRGLKRRHQNKAVLPDMKMSARLEQVAQPLLAGLGGWDGSEEYLEEVRSALSAAAIAWNHAVAVDADANRQSSEELLAEMPPDARTVVEGLVERKRDLYPDDFRLAFKLEVFRRGNAFRIQVASTTPQK